MPESEPPGLPLPDGVRTTSTITALSMRLLRCTAVVLISTIYARTTHSLAAASGQPDPRRSTDVEPFLRDRAGHADAQSASGRRLRAADRAHPRPRFRKLHARAGGH